MPTEYEKVKMLLSGYKLIADWLEREVKNPKNPNTLVKIPKDLAAHMYEAIRLDIKNFEVMD